MSSFKKMFSTEQKLAQINALLTADHLLSLDEAMAFSKLFTTDEINFFKTECQFIVQETYVVLNASNMEKFVGATSSGSGSITKKIKKVLQNKEYKLDSDISMDYDAFKKFLASFGTPQALKTLDLLGRIEYILQVFSEYKLYFQIKALQASQALVESEYKTTIDNLQKELEAKSSITIGSILVDDMKAFIKRITDALNSIKNRILRR